MTNKTAIKSVCNFSQGSSISEKPVSANQIFSCFGITKILVESPLKTKHFVISLGNRYLAVNRFLLDCGDVCQEEKTKCHINLHEWALDAIFQPNCDDIINVLSARNRVTSVDWRRGEKLYTYECATSCILYSGKLRNSSNDGKLIVTGGTVFKQILIWFANTKDRNRVCPVEHHLHNHDGVIFDIDYSAKYHKLASASDDRTVRVWNYPDPDRSLIKSSEHILYGHQSRVWCVKFIDSDYASYHSLLISGGEDGSAFVWNHQTGARILSVNLSSSSLWSVTQSKFPLRLYYGSNYGRVISCDLISLIKNSPTIPCCEPDSKTAKRGSDILTSLCWVAKDAVSMNKSGVIRLYTLDKSTRNLNIEVVSVKGLDTESCFESYSTMAVSGSNQVAIGDKDGRVYLFNFSRESKCDDISIDRSQVVTAHDGGSKVCSLEWLDNDTLLSSDVFGRIKVWKVDGFEKSNFIGIHKLPKSRHPWVTTTSFIKSFNGNYRILVGDRSGGVYFYKEGQVDPQNCYPKLHGVDGVSSVQLTKSGMVYTTGRDGRIMELSLIKDQLILMRTFFKSKSIEWTCRLILDPEDESPMKVLGFHSTNFIEYDLRMSRISWSVSCGGGHRLWLYDIDVQGTSNFIYTKFGTLHRELKDATEGSIEKMTYCGKHPPLCANYHSSQIRCCAIISSNYRINCSVFATGGDDNIIVIQQFDSSTGAHTRVLQTLYGHISCVKSLTATKFSGTDSDYLLVSGGGRCQMIFWKITLSSDSVGITTREIKNISIDDFENPKTHKETKRKVWKNMNHDGRCGEARIMSMSMICEKNECGDIRFTIACACSDAIFRLFHLDYDPVMEEYLLKLAFSSSADGSCLNVAHLLSGTTCLIGSNEGSMMIYSKRNEDSWKRTNKWRPHSRGVMDVATEKAAGHLLVASVGDDNQLNVGRLKTNKDSCYQDSMSLDEDFKLSNKYAHDAQASGIVILDKGQQFLTCSVDQRLTLWNVCDPSSQSTVATSAEDKQRHVEDTSTFLVPVASTISNVADVTGCCILNESSASSSVTSLSSSSPTSTTAELYIIIYGFGLEIFKLLR